MISIYRLYVEGHDACYVGSTRTKIQNVVYRRTNCTSNIIFDLGEVKYELLETCTVENRKERHRYWIDTIPNNVNKNIPGGPEYYKLRAKQRKEQLYQEMRKALLESFLQQE